MGEVATEPLFSSPLGLFGFQADAAARIYWQWTETSEPVILVLYDTGIGKTVISLVTLAMLVEDGLVDQVLVVAEANKVLDWVEDDFPTFTRLSVRQYAGDLKRRRKMLVNPPQVLVLSYETGRNDICEFKGPKSLAIVGEKMLATALRGKRVAIVFDEFSKLRNRSNKTYLAWSYLVNKVLRAGPHQPRLLGLTATTVEKNPEDHWNAGRLLSPARAGGVSEFEGTYIASRDLFGNPATWTALTPQEAPPGIIPLNQRFAPITIRKRKTDDDVIDHFPAKMENPPTMVTLDPRHRSLYDMVSDIFDDPDLSDEVARQGFGLLRQIAGHPMSLLRSQGEYARAIVGQVGSAYLEGLRNAKGEALLEWQARMGEQQTVIFTFYGGAILPYLEHTLTSHDYRVSVNSGSMSDTERKRSQDAFKAGDTQIFLSSDAGAKGLNLGVGSGLLHYENPILYSTFEQRSNRCVVEGQLVQTSRGFIPVEEVEIGDLVLTHLNRWRPVIDTSRTHQQQVGRQGRHIVGIDYYRYSEPLEVTNDHRVFVSRAGEEPAWTPAEDLRPGDFLVTPRPTPGAGLEFDVLGLESDWLYTLGFYLGNGWSRDQSGNRYVAFATENTKADRLEPMRRIAETWGAQWSIYPASDGGHGVEAHIFSPEMARWFLQHLGTGSRRKHLPNEWLQQLTAEQARLVLDGYLAADGYQRNNQYEWTSVSPTIALDAGLLSLMTQHGPSLRRVSSGVNQGQWIGCETREGRQTSLDRADDRYVYQQVRKVHHRFPRQRGHVYDLTVEEDHSFVVGQAIVHNCHRIDSRHASVTIDSLCVRGTIEEPITRIMLKRNQWAEKTQDADYTEDFEPSERFLRAADRLAMFTSAR